MTNGYAVHLSGGMYLDANGNIVDGVPSAAQIYQVPGGFHFDAKKVQETFKDLSDILPRDEEGKKKWKDWGVPTELVDSLSKLAGLAGIVATAISFYAWAIGAMLAIMDLLAEEDGISPELGRALVSFKNQIKGNEEIALADKMLDLHSEFAGRVQLARGKIIQLAVEEPTGDARAKIFSDLRSIVDQLTQPLTRLANEDWSVTHDVETYVGKLRLLHLLYIQKPDGSMGNAMLPAGLTAFDYRLGVPMLLYGTTTFAALARVAMPWFRSAGIYAEQFRSSADAIDRFVLGMQAKCLARTEHTDMSIFRLVTNPAGEWPESNPVIPIGGPRRTYKTFPAGAFDLIRYNDAFLGERWLEAFQTGGDQGLRGTFDYSWEPSPAGLNAVGEASDFDIIAAEANERARQDYANLQVATGMFRLILTSAWLRFLSTPPDRSETVSGETAAVRQWLDQVPTIAKSPKIFPIGIIEHPATLKRYNARSRALITTQEPGYGPAFRYRIVLRTLESWLGRGGWDERDYFELAWKATYEPTAGDPRCKRLKTVVDRGAILSEIELYEGPSPVHTVTRSSKDALNTAGGVKLVATTFDWYVPVLRKADPFMPPSNKFAADRPKSGGDKKAMLGSGGLSIHLARGEVFRRSGELQNEPASPLMMAIEDTWGVHTKISADEISLGHAERRHVRQEDVTVDWELSWTGDRLDVRLTGRPEQRPFQAVVVVEETVYSGEIPAAGVSDLLGDPQVREHLHTPFVTEMVNQIVLVPQPFFVEERNAIQRANKFWFEFMRKYAKSAPIGPGDPVISMLDEVSQRLHRSPSTETLFAGLDTKAAFALRERPELWEQVLREAGDDAAIAPEGVWPPRSDR